MTNEDKFSALGIDKKYWEICYISDDGTVFAPTIYNGEVYQTGKEAYESYLKQIDTSEAKTTEQRLEELDNQIESLRAMYYELLLEL